MLIISENRKVRHDYEILEVFEAGLVLKGSEVKSLRLKQVTLKDSYVSFQGNEAFIQKMHINEYKQSGTHNHHPERIRKLLLHKNELHKLESQINEKGLTCVPLKIYFKNGVAKVELALVKGKKLHDKRESIKQRDAQRSLQKAMKL